MSSEERRFLLSLPHLPEEQMSVTVSRTAAVSLCSPCIPMPDHSLILRTDLSLIHG